MDPAEAGGTGVRPMHIGHITLSGSAWVESERDDAFRVRRARLGLAGSLVPKIGWNVSGEFSSEPALRNAFVVFRLHDQFHVRVGQATPPSGLERGTSPLTLELIDRSRPSTRLTSALDPSVSVMNDRPFAGWLSYAFSVASGAGFNRWDDNRAKDFVGRLLITPPHLAGLSLVGSGSTGEQPYGRRTRTGLGIQYNVTRFKLAAEGLRQHLEWAPDAEGFYTTAVYRIRPRRVTPHFRMIDLAVRYAVMYDPAAARGGSFVIDEDGGPGATHDVMPVTTRELQAGGNYYLNRNVRLMLNVVRAFDERETKSVIGRMQVVF